VTVVPLVPSPAIVGGDDVPLASPSSPADSGFGGALEHALEATASALRRADAAERGFAIGRGGLQEMVVERARADVALSLATAAASRTAQALTTILGMQV
jgi:flagellar hook-basal body complex protein FliE